MLIHIHQGRTSPPTVADCTIVIDVIRAFTVAHNAFLQGAEKIYLAETVEQAIEFKRSNPLFLLAGEVDGLSIKGFDFDNSPVTIQQHDLAGKTLVQKTTNGVQAALNCLASEHIFVTGFMNARTTAEFVKRMIPGKKQETVNIIASHPSGDDDLACAEYIKSIVEGSNTISSQEVIQRIMRSHAAEKFLDEKNSAFKMEDIFLCIEEHESDFVMRVTNTGKIPMIERVNFRWK